MRRYVRSLAVAIAAALAGRGATAQAKPRPRTSSIGWVRLPGAEACIGARELAQAVEEQLGRTVFVSPTQAEVLIEGRIEPAPPSLPSGGAGFRAHISLSDASGSALGARELEGGIACRALDEQLALVIALLIDPDAALAPKPPAVALPSTPPPVAPVAPIAPVLPTAPAALPAAHGLWRESLAVGPAFALGLLPGAGFGLSLRGEILPPSLFPLEIGGTVWLDAHAQPAGAAPSAEGVTLSLAYGMVGVCPLAWSSGRTRLRGCTDLDIGALRSVGYGFAAPNGAGKEEPIVSASLEGRVTRRLVGPLEIGVGIALLVPFHRVRIFYLDAALNEHELFRTGVVAGLFDADLGLGFP